MATSVVPPPMSMIMLPVASATGSPAPIAAAIGSSRRITLDAPAPLATSTIDFLSTWVDPQGTQIRTLGFGLKKLLTLTLAMNSCSMRPVLSKSEMTPFFMGRMACRLPGVLPSILFASSPTACTVRWALFGSVLIATTDGSFRTMPLPRA